MKIIEKYILEEVKMPVLFGISIILYPLIRYYYCGYDGKYNSKGNMKKREYCGSHQNSIFLFTSNIITNYSNGNIF